MSGAAGCEEMVHLSLADASILKACAQSYQALMEKWPNRRSPSDKHTGKPDCPCVECRALQAVRDEYARIEDVRRQNAV